ncbi:MAG: hypothetical protein N2748_05465 [candidate division WOR-3 bacterium]|nr:hypothetical protein [candidate division WOR-3 bacterium]
MLAIILSCILIGQDIEAVLSVEKPINPQEYQLLPGDKVLISVVGKVTYSYNTFVTYEGKIQIKIPTGTISTPEGKTIPRYDAVDMLTVSELTLAQAQDSLNRRFQHYLRDISGKLTLIGIRTGKVLVTGEVQ